MTLKHMPLRNLTPTSGTFHSQQQELAQGERLCPTTLPPSGYEISARPEQTFRQTVAVPKNIRYRTILCRNYTLRGRCSFGPSCKFVHDPFLFVVSDQRRRRADHVLRCDDYIQGMRRRGCNKPSLGPRQVSTLMKFIPLRSKGAPTCGAFRAFDHPEASPPPVSQPDVHRLRTLSVTDPLALDFDPELGEDRCDIIEDFSVTKFPLSFLCHAVEVRTPVGGRWSHLFMPRPSQPTSPFLQIYSAGKFGMAPPHVQSPTVPPCNFQSSKVPPDSQSNPLKELVDELPPFPFVHSPLTDIQRKTMRSMTYEDLPIGAREESPLRRRKSLPCFKSSKQRVGNFAFTNGAGNFPM